MIEIDEATKGIMNDLQSSIASNIEGGVSAGLRRMSEDNQSQITTLQTALSTKLSALEEELTSSKKPMSRLSRDVEDILRLLTKLQSSINEKLEKVEQIQVNQIQAMNDKVEAIFNQAIEKQQASADESMKQFKSETIKANTFLTNEVANIKQSFEVMTTDVTTKLQAQFNAVQKEQEELAKRAKELQSIQGSFEQLMNSQKVKFEVMKEELLETSNQALLVQQKNFEEQLQALAASREQLVKVTTDAQAKQLQSIQSEQRHIISQLVSEVEKTSDKIIKDVTNSAVFDRLQQSIVQTENSILTGLAQGPILQKLDKLQKELEYAGLPFYKKWFTRKDVK